MRHVESLEAARAHLEARCERIVENAENPEQEVEHDQ